MNYPIYSAWASPPKGDVSPRPPLPLVLDRPAPAMAPSLVGCAIAAFIERGREVVRAIARGIIRFVGFVQQFLSDRGLPPAAPTPVAPIAAVVARSLDASAQRWAMAAEWADFGRLLPTAAAGVPPVPAPLNVAQVAPRDAAPIGSSVGPVDPLGVEVHRDAPMLDEPASSLDRSRGWLKATNPLRDEEPSTEGVAWGELPVDEVQRILSIAVSTRARTFNGVRPGCERDALTGWLGTVSRIAYNDPIQRLWWMATLAPSLARNGIADDRRGELIGAVVKWLGDVDPRDSRAMLGALHAVERIAASGIDPDGELFEQVGAAWLKRAWPRMRGGDAGELLRVGVTQMTAALARREGSRARMFAQLILAIAPSCYVDVAERLTWFARAVARPVGMAGLDGAPVRDVLTRGLGRWFEALTRGSTCGAVDVVLEWWASPLGACTHEEPVARWLAAARPGRSDRVLNE
ncbi:MAG: hypothetical protein Q8S73_41920 [Deltaproteobacteria bacterium]|nr:hypothetical protein [Myxococcales bacterium]MDP3220719.1 hypothetical protein [Deltaproteobacteria bacterium]